MVSAEEELSIWVANENSCYILLFSPVIYQQMLLRFMFQLIRRRYFCHSQRGILPVEWMTRSCQKEKWWASVVLCVVGNIGGSKYHLCSHLKIINHFVSCPINLCLTVIVVGSTILHIFSKQKYFIIWSTFYRKERERNTQRWLGTVLCGNKDIWSSRIICLDNSHWTPVKMSNYVGLEGAAFLNSYKTELSV